MNPDSVVAYHEAAHAVVAIFLGYPIGKVTIVAEQDCTGACEVDYGCAYRVLWGSRSAEDKRDAASVTVGLLAGIAAEIRLTGHYDEHQCSVDTDTAYDLAREVARREADAYYERALKKAKRIVKSQWYRIGLLASALLERKTLTDEEVYAVIGLQP